jgi:hypothetical protein
MRDLNGWIPEVDIDGLDVDARRGFVSETENIVYENGFIRPETKPVVLTRPFTPTANEEIISATTFYHSTQGWCYVYGIWNSSTSLFYIYLKNDSVSQYVHIQAATSMTKPTRIVYAEYDDVLKINTNVVVNQATNQVPIAQLTLEKLSDYDYGEGFARTAGWYLTPRWLGYTYHNSSNSEVRTVSPETGAAGFNADGELVIDNTNYTTNPHVTYSGITAGAGTTLNISTTGVLHFNSVNNADSIKVTVDPGASNVDKLIVRATRISDDEVVFESEYSFNFVSGQLYYIIAPIHLLGDDSYTVDVIAHPDNVGTVNIHEAKITPIYSYAIMTDFGGQKTKLVHHNVYLDGALYKPATTDPHPIFDYEFEIRVDQEDVDIRDDLLNWYFFTKWENETIYYKAGRDDIFVDALVVVPPDYYSIFHTIKEPDVVETLNSYYGLGVTVLPFVQGNADGLLIFDEIYHRNRAYFVHGTKKIFMSHIAGDGRLQEDSFPYDADVEFGFIYADNSDDALVALSTTPLDEIVTLSNYNALVYVSQHTQAGVFRRIKALNGAVGIGNRNMLSKNNKGNPLAEVLVWTDDKGAYIYGGGVNHPKNVVSGTLYNYWKTFYTSSIITAYNPMRNEILFISDDLVVVLDLGTLFWRKIRFEYQIEEFAGIIGSKPYFLTSNKTLVYLDDGHSERLEGALVTHYTANYAVDDRGSFIPLGEMTDKFMQELYMSMHTVGVNIGSPIGIYMDIIADGNVIAPRVYFSGQVQFEKTIAPLLVRYRQVKIRLILSNTNYEIKEFGYTHNVDTESIIRQVNPGIAGTGFGSNFGNDFGVHL